MDDRKNQNQNPPNTNQTSPPQPVSSNPNPEHEPLAFHFGNFKEALTNIEHHESQTPAETLPSPLANQSYVPPILQKTTPATTPTAQTQTLPTSQHPPLPLTDAEIESNAHSKKIDSSLHWLALWCIRQLEMYEKTISKK